MSLTASCIIVLHVLILVQVSVCVQHAEGRTRQKNVAQEFKKKKKKAKWCLLRLFHHYFSPTPSLTCSQTPSMISPHRGRKGRRSVQWEFFFFSPSLSLPLRFPKHLLERPVSWLCSPQSGKHFSVRPLLTLLRVCCGCCWARDAPRPSSLLNPMRWAFLSRLQGN